MSKDLEPVRESIERRRQERLRKAEAEAQLPAPRTFDWKAWRSNRQELIHKLRKGWGK